MPYPTPFGMIEERTRAAVPEGGETVPYFVGAYRFEANCGLYFLLGYEDAALEGEVHRLLKLLQYSGIGGKISSGFGKFRLEKCDQAGIFRSIRRRNGSPRP